LRSGDRGQEAFQPSGLLPETLDHGASRLHRAGHVLSGATSCGDVQAFQPRGFSDAVSGEALDERGDLRLVFQVKPDLDVEAGTAVDVAKLGFFRPGEALGMQEVEGRCQGFVVRRLPGADTAEAHALDGTALGTLVMPYCSGLGNLLFVAIVALIVSEISPSVVAQYPDQLETDPLDRIGLYLTRAAAEITRPVSSLAPIGSLAKDECVPPGEVARVALTDLVALPFLFSFLSAFFMPRKQDD
jgi:hypothetical protein